MSEIKSTHPVNVVILIGFFGAVGLLGMAGLLFLGWKSVNSSSPNDSGTETEKHSRVIGGPNNDGRQTIHEKKPGGIAG